MEDRDQSSLLDGGNHLLAGFTAAVCDFSGAHSLVPMSLEDGSVLFVLA